MTTVRIWFKKQNEASYISLLDMQRVMQRVLTRSQLPIRHTQGFNPHIYMTFSCPLALGQESLCESVDVKTEDDNADFTNWQTVLNGIMPSGIEVFKIEPADMKAEKIAFAEYSVSYPAVAMRVIEQYNTLENAIVRKKTKKGFKDIDLKEHLPQIDAKLNGEQVDFDLRLPAGGTLNLNPMLLAEFLEEISGLPACYAQILRTSILTAEGESFK